MQPDKLLLTEPAGEASFAACFLHQPRLNRADHMLKLFHHPGFVTSHGIISKLGIDKHRHTAQLGSEAGPVVKERKGKQPHNLIGGRNSAITEKCAKTQGTKSKHCERAAAGSAWSPEIPASLQEEQPPFLIIPPSAATV